VIDTSGAGAVAIVSDAESNAFPAWSPDGLRIAFSTSDWTIDLVDPDGQNRTTLSDSVFQGPRDLAWSPDGSQLAFVSDDGVIGGIDALRVIASDGSNLRTITETLGTPLEDNDPAFDPTGTSLIFWRRDSSDFTEHIMLIGLSGGAPPQSIRNGLSPHWRW